MSLIGDFDDRFTALVRKLPDSIRPLVSTISFMGEPLVVLLIGFAGYANAYEHADNDVQHALVYSAIACIGMAGLKQILRRARPHGLIVKTLGLQSYSFPSGHAFSTVVIYGQFAFLDIKYLAHPYNYLIAAVFWIIVVAIGVSRVYLGAHYPSDVIAGWVLGGLSLTIINLLAY